MNTLKLEKNQHVIQIGYIVLMFLLITFKLPSDTIAVACALLLPIVNILVFRFVLFVKSDRKQLLDYVFMLYDVLVCALCFIVYFFYKYEIILEILRIVMTLAVVFSVYLLCIRSLFNKKALIPDDTLNGITFYMATLSLYLLNSIY